MVTGPEMWTDTESEPSILAINGTFVYTMCASRVCDGGSRGLE